MLAALLAALTLLSLAACGSTAASDEANTPQQTEQTDPAAKPGSKTDGSKTDAANAGSKTDGTGTSKTDAANGKNDAVKTDQPVAEPDKNQQDANTSTDKDNTGSDKPETPTTPTTPTQPDTPSTPAKSSCTISISCGTILNNMDMCRESKKGYVPSNGTILSTTTVTFEEGETVYDVLQRVCRDKGIQMDASWTAAYNSAYVKGIANLYEFDVGEGSGWMYKVNGWFPNYGCSSYDLEDGDNICWVYTCDLGDDVGGGYMG